MSEDQVNLRFHYGDLTFVCASSFPFWFPVFILLKKLHTRFAKVFFWPLKVR